MNAAVMSLTDAIDSRLVDHTISFSNGINLHLGRIGKGQVVCVGSDISPDFALYAVQKTRVCDLSYKPVFARPGCDRIAQSHAAAAADRRQHRLERFQVHLREHRLDRQNRASRH